MTKFKEWPDATINVLVGGTPCQSFSVAGLRKGLDDPRGNLMLIYLAIADRYKPKWIVWENVPGVLSSNGGRDFGTFLGGLGQLGYGFAYRVLDAQFSRTHEHPRAVPQRRIVPTYALAGNTIGRAPENGGNGTGYDDTGSSYTLTKTDVHAVAYEEHTGTIRKEPGDNQMAVCSQMRVRRLTPLECERLQGFPEVTKTVILRVCSDHQKTNALAETQCPKLPNVAGNAVVSESQKIASFAEVNSRQSNHKTSELAEVSALLNLEARTLEIHNQGKLLLSVNLADKQKWCRLPIQLDDFVQLNVRLHTLLGTNTIVGGAALPQNINNSSHHGYGSKSVDVSGQEIEQLVSDATKFMSTKNDCIPEQMHNGNSYAINLSLTHGYTNIPGASNSARYKALGNSMAVNCMRILGERIAMMETIDVISDLL
jgi:site-specific DNA-cytosine methylase